MQESRTGFQIERLHNYNARQDRWIDMLVEDKRASVADQVAARMDVRDLVRDVISPDEADCQGSGGWLLNE